MKIFSQFGILYLVIVLTLLTLSNCGAFWHLTDTHSDWLYKVGARSNGTNCNSGFGFSAGEFGSHHCYNPVVLEEETVRHMAQLDPRPNFILYGGDTFPGVPYSHDDLINVIRNVT